jgi:hypothetical protein
MPQQLFSDIGPTLLQYKDANVLGRQAMLLDAIAISRKSPQNLAEAKLHLQELSYAATLINYADVLKRMESKDFFDILFDFNAMELSAELQEWFEFKNPGKMRLKKEISEYTPAIWEQFRQAQKAHLDKTNKGHLFNLDQLDIAHPPANQLFPIQIQMLGKLHNEAVDRINVNAKGEIRFAKRFGSYLLPGGGMVEISNSAKVDALMHKMLEEHLEEEHANLYVKAASLYNELPQDRFNQGLADALNSKQAQASTIKDNLLDVLNAEGSNAEHLRRIIELIDGKLENESNSEVKKALVELRAIVQVRTFSLTPLFAEAFQHIKANTKLVDIQQYLDTRAAGGSQMSHTFIMTKPLEEWFKSKFDGVDIEFGDDISGSEIERLTLLQAIAQFRQVKFSHLLIGLAAYKEAFANNTLDLKKVWDDQQYKAACEAIGSEAIKLLKPALELNELAQTQLVETLSALPDAKRQLILELYHQLLDDLNEAKTEEEKKFALNYFVGECKETLEGKYASVLKSVLTITAIAVSAVLAGAAGFGIGFALGLWTGPGAFFTAVAGASYAALAVVGASGVSAGIAGTLAGIGLFRPSKELVGVKTFADQIRNVIDPTKQLEEPSSSSSSSSSLSLR